MAVASDSADVSAFHVDYVQTKLALNLSEKNVTKDVMGYRSEPATIHVIEGRAQGVAQVEAGGAMRREDVSFKYAGRQKHAYNFPQEVRTIPGLRDYLVARLADKAVAVTTFGPDPVEALLATDGDLKPGNKFAEAESCKRAFTMDPGEKYFADPLKRIDVSLDFAQRGASMKADLDRARQEKAGLR